MMWKIQKVQIREEIYDSRDNRGLFPEEQKRNHKRTRGIGDLQYIDQHILNESKARRENVATVSINKKKADDIVPQSWIVDCQKCTRYLTKSSNSSRKS